MNVLFIIWNLNRGLGLHSRKERKDAIFIQVTQLLYQLLHIYKIYTLKH